MGVLKEGHLVEVDRSNLVAGYTGQTAIKTDEIVNKAINGILFIDEAYTLSREKDSNDSFGKEAIDTLLKRMEDLRDQIVIIAAGYSDEMENFLNANPGLKSRFNRYLEFPDYNPKQLTEIFLAISSKNGFKYDNTFIDRLNSLFEKLYAKKDKAFGNARLVRNLFEKTFEKHANRTASIQNITFDDLTTLSSADLADV